jgi:hypothetical protein
MIDFWFSVRVYSLVQTFMLYWLLCVSKGFYGFWKEVGFCFGLYEHVFILNYVLIRKIFKAQKEDSLILL